MMIIDKIKKMLGYNILTLRQNKETDIDDYDIALIKLCKMFRINIKHQQFFADHIVDSVKIPYHPSDYFEKLLINNLYEKPSTKRNHHLIFFQYLVKLLCQKEEISNKRIDTFEYIGTYMLIKYNREYIQELIKKWSSPECDPCFHVWQDCVKYYQAFRVNYMFNSYDINLRKARKIFSLNSKSVDFEWHVWDNSASWLYTWFAEITKQHKVYRSSHSTVKDRLTQCFNTLEITYTKNKSIIKNAYRRACLKSHPDKGGSQEKFIEVTQSYEYIMTHV